MRILGRLILNPRQIPEIGWIEVEHGVITRVETSAPSFQPDLGDATTLISPGFIDAHMHVPQIGAIGCDGLPLLEWLETVIFPTEERWSDPTCIRSDIALTQARLIRAGTLSCAGFLSPHTTGPEWLTTHPLPVSMRMMLGQALMNREAPTDLAGHALVEPRPLASPRVELSMNPRFAVSCDEDLLNEAGRVARQHDTFIQTHLAESEAEVEFVRRQFPDALHYTDVYDRAGLLGSKTLLAHGIHLSDAEWELIRARHAVVVHCPTANTFLGSGLFQLDRARDHQVRLALGSDIGAGPDIAMPRVARAMIEVARLRRSMIQDKTLPPDPTPAEAWELMTRGNADALGWSDAGRLEPGARADLLLLRPELELDEHWLGRLLFGWSDTWITDRLIGGTAVCPDAITN